MKISYGAFLGFSNRIARELPGRQTSSLKFHNQKKIWPSVYGQVCIIFDDWLVDRSICKLSTDRLI